MFKARENQAKLISERPFIFQESKSDISKDSYVEWSAQSMKKSGEEVHIFDIPCAYKFDLVDKYKKNIVTTGYNPAPNGGTYLFSIFQLNRKSHAMGTYHFDVEDLGKDFMSIVLISSKSTGMIDFMAENKDIEESFVTARTTGFGSR